MKNHGTFEFTDMDGNELDISWDVSIETDDRYGEDADGNRGIARNTLEVDFGATNRKGESVNDKLSNSDKRMICGRIEEIIEGLNL